MKCWAPPCRPAPLHIPSTNRIVQFFAFQNGPEEPPAGQSGESAREHFGRLERLEFRPCVASCSFCLYALPRLPALSAKEPQLLGSFARTSSFPQAVESVFSCARLSLRELRTQSPYSLFMGRVSPVWLPSICRSKAALWLKISRFETSMFT